MEKIKEFFKKALEVIFRKFWLVFNVAIIVAVLDLVSITQKDIGLGFIIAFLYFVAYIIYKGVEKTTIKFPEKPKQL